MQWPCILCLLGHGRTEETCSLGTSFCFAFSGPDASNGWNSGLGQTLGSASDHDVIHHSQLSSRQIAWNFATGTSMARGFCEVTEGLSRKEGHLSSSEKPSGKSMVPIAGDSWRI